jgi:hypothetical protein
MLNRMAAFDLTKSLALAQERFGANQGDMKARRSRSDRGRSRLPGPIVEFLNKALSGLDRPRFADLEADVARFSDEHGFSCPSKATLYYYLTIAPLPAFEFGSLPLSVRASLYNLGDGSRVPAHQVVFAAFNYGDIGAISFAAGLPWLALYQADRTRGWRPKSHALLRAVMKGRGL